MKQFKYILFILGMVIPSLSNAQIRISETAGDIHPRAILEIDSNKGVILPVAEDFTQFPNYDESEPDLFTDDPSLLGMLMYNKAENKLFVYNGESWVPSNAKSFRADNKITLLRSSHPDITKVNILNISTRDVVPFNLYQVINDKNVNNANIIPLDLDGNDGYADTFQISESGWYKINPSIMIKSGGGLTVGNIDAIAVLMASFVNDPENSSSPYSNWWALMQHDFSLEGLLISVGGGNKAMNFEYVRHFDAGDRIRFEIGIRNPDGLSVGSGITYMCSDINSFLYFEKLD